MYKAIKFFQDLKDNNYPYEAGDIYPREGLKVSEERLAELASDKNLRKEPLIAKVEEKKAEGEKKPTAKKATKKTAGK
jgi:hypothetical protein